MMFVTAESLIKNRACKIGLDALRLAIGREIALNDVFVFRDTPVGIEWKVWALRCAVGFDADRLKSELNVTSLIRLFDDYRSGSPEFRALVESKVMEFENAGA